MWMILVRLLIGISSLSGQHMLFWLELLAYLASTLVIVFLVIEERREHIARQRAKELTTTTEETIASELMAKWKPTAAKASKYVGVLLLGTFIGWLWREHQFNLNHFTYYGVQVVERYSAKSFLIHPAGMKKNYEVDFDVPQDFERGQRMRELSFEQRIGYKHLLWADFCPDYCDKNGRRLIYKEEVTNVGY